MLRTFTLATFAVWLLVGTHAAPDTGAEPDPTDPFRWRSLERDGVTVVARPADAGYASHVLDVALSKGRAVARTMSLDGLAPLTIAIASSDTEFSELSSHGAPDWEVACAFPERGLVVLRSPRIVAYPIQMESVLTHELAHIAAGRALARVDVPRWFEEGIAMTIAGEWPLDDATPLPAAAAAGTLIPLAELARAFPSDGRAASLAYAESFHAVSFLVREGRVAGPAELVAAIAAAGDFDRAVRALYGGPREDFERAALRSLNRGAGWGLLLRGFGPLFQVLAVAVAAGAFTLAWRSRRRDERRDDSSRARPRSSSDGSESRWE